MEGSILEKLSFLPRDLKQKLGEEIEKIKTAWAAHDKKTEEFYNDTMMAVKALDEKLDEILKTIGKK
jgi:hypothetical protein